MIVKGKRKILKAPAITAEQKALLLAHYKTTTITELAKKIGVCETYVKFWMQELNIRKRRLHKPVPDDAAEFITAHYLTMTQPELAEQLSVDKDVINIWVKKLGLSKTSHDREVNCCDSKGFFVHDPKLATI